MSNETPGHDAASGPPTSERASPLRAGAAIDRFCAASRSWSTTRVLDEGLDLARDTAWADHAALVAIGGHGATIEGATIEGATIEEVARRPLADPALPVTGRRLDPAWFPWGLAPVNPRRFLLVADARELPVAPGSATTLGQLGIRSCLHLPVVERQHPVGALQLAWGSPRTDWDDRLGRLLRILGRLLLDRVTDDGPSASPDDQPAGRGGPGS